MSTCGHCGAETRGSRPYCNRECYKAAVAPTSEATRTCEHCDNPIPRGSDRPYRYARRRFCSHRCAVLASEGQDSPLRRPDPERHCESCGARLVRERSPCGKLEGLQRFSTRRFCSKACAKRGRDWSRFDNDPSAIGARTLLAKSCKRCGTLRMGGDFYTRPSGLRDSECISCKRQLAVSYRDKRQQESLARASRNGYVWTGAELELLATRDDLTRHELAEMLGRTFAAVTLKRAQVKKDPKWMKAAGVDDA